MHQFPYNYFFFERKMRTMQYRYWIFFFTLSSVFDWFYIHRKVHSPLFQLTSFNLFSCICTPFIPIIIRSVCSTCCFDHANIIRQQFSNIKVNTIDDYYRRMWKGMQAILMYQMCRESLLETISICQSEY